MIHRSESKSPIVSFNSGVNSVKKSWQHKDMWIINCPNGTFFNVHASERQILIQNPPNNQQVTLLNGKAVSVKPEEDVEA